MSSYEKKKLDTTGLEDKGLTCQNKEHEGGDRSFVWTKGEQAFMNQLVLEGKLEGTLSNPRNCPNCRERRRVEKLQREMNNNDEENY